MRKLTKMDIKQLRDASIADVDWYGSKIRDFRQGCPECRCSDFNLGYSCENAVSFNIHAICKKCGYAFPFSVFSGKHRGVLRDAIKSKSTVRLSPMIGSTTMQRMIITIENHEPVKVAVPCGYCPLADRRRFRKVEALGQPR